MISLVPNNSFLLKKLSIRLLYMLSLLLTRDSNNKKVPFSVPFSSLTCMPIFVLVGKLIFLSCKKSALIMSFTARTINQTPLK